MIHCLDCICIMPVHVHSVLSVRGGQKAYAALSPFSSIHAGGSLPASTAVPPVVPPPPASISTTPLLSSVTTSLPFPAERGPATKPVPLALSAPLSGASDLPSLVTLLATPLPSIPPNAAGPSRVPHLIISPALPSIPGKVMERIHNGFLWSSKNSWRTTFSCGRGSRSWAKSARSHHL